MWPASWPPSTRPKRLRMVSRALDFNERQEWTNIGHRRLLLAVFKYLKGLMING
jgi:hypothetical protein